MDAKLEAEVAGNGLNYHTCRELAAWRQGIYNNLAERGGVGLRVGRLRYAWMDHSSQQRKGG